MKQPTNVLILFTIDRKDAEICRECDRQRLEECLDGDGEYLSLHDNRFIISRYYWLKPDLLNGKIYLTFKIEVEAEKADDNFTPEDLRSYLYKNSSLCLPWGMIRKETSVTIPSFTLFPPNPNQPKPTNTMTEKESLYILAQAANAAELLSAQLKRFSHDEANERRSAQLEIAASDLARHAAAIREASGITALTAANLAELQANLSTR